MIKPDWVLESLAACRRVALAERHILNASQSLKGALRSAGPTPTGSPVALSEIATLISEDESPDGDDHQIASNPSTPQASTPEPEVVTEDEDVTTEEDLPGLPLITDATEKDEADKVMDEKDTDGASVATSSHSGTEDEEEYGRQRDLASLGPAESETAKTKDNESALKNQDSETETEDDDEVGTNLVTMSRQ